MINLDHLPEEIIKDYPFPPKHIKDHAATVAAMRFSDPHGRKFDLAICENIVTSRSSKDEFDDDGNVKWTKWTDDTCEDHAHAVRHAREMAEKLSEQGYTSPTTGPALVPLSWTNLRHFRTNGRTIRWALNWASGLFDRIEAHVAKLDKDDLPDDAKDIDDTELGRLLGDLEEDVKRIEDLAREAAS